MSATTIKLKSILTGQIPEDLIDVLLKEYNEIKGHYFLQKFRPSELNASRFCECILRIVEYLDKGTYTPLGQQLNTDKIILDASNNINLKETIRFFIPRLSRVLLDVRNKRDIAHLGGEVNPNFSDSKFVVHASDWILTEIVRHLYNCSIDEAQRIVANINEIKIPIIADINGFVRIQNTDLTASDKVLVILYYKNPDVVTDSNIIKWLRYKNPTRMKKQILRELDDQALIHYEAGSCLLLPKGINYVEKNVTLYLIK